MRRTYGLLLALPLGACLEPGGLSSPDEIYAAIYARDVDAGRIGTAGTDAGGMGGGDSGTTSDASMGGACGDVLEELIKPRCALSVCHSTEASATLSFDAENLATSLIGTQGTGSCADHVYIDAENPEQSLIYTKLSETPPCGLRMPLSGPLLTDGERACVLQLVEQLIAEE